MWILFAAGSAVFAALTSILAKIGIKNTDSDVATAIRCVVVLLFSWVMVFIVGSFDTLYTVDGKTWLFLVLSGMATGASWLCYFRALQNGDINKVVPIDKSSTVLTIILAFIFLNESITIQKGAGVVLIAAGTFMMIQKKTGEKKVKYGKWVIYTILSAVFASLTSILAKIGIDGVESNLGTAIRTSVVLIMAWLIVFVRGKQLTIKSIGRRELLFLILSGFATGASWLCYYKALKNGLASVVVPIDKLSILITVAFSYIVFREKLSLKAGAGLVLITAGTLCMIL